MSKTSHAIYLALLTVIAVITLVLPLYYGYSFYNTGLEERPFHDDYQSLKPSGLTGHGFGIVGSLLMLIGVTAYMLRKRSRKLSRLGLLKHWLEFHIFLCTVGPIMVLYHTSFKFGGIVAVSFWSMVAVFLSGIIGRFIYIQIPRTIEGREMSLNEVRDMKSGIQKVLSESYNLDLEEVQTIAGVKAVIKKKGLSRAEGKKLLRLVKNDISLNRRIDRLVMMQNLFKYWHVAHLPFAFVMLIIMIIHVVVTIVFGYHWIF